MRRIVAGLAAVFLLPAMLFAQTKQQSSLRPAKESIEAASSASGSVYKNDFFQFTYGFPISFTGYYGADIHKIMKEGHHFAFGGDPEADPEHRRMESQVIALLDAVGEPPKGSIVPPSVTIFAWDKPGESPPSAQDAMKQILSEVAAGPSDSAGFRLVGAPAEQRIGSLGFWRADLRADLQARGIKISVRMAVLVTSMKKYPVIWLLTAEGENQLHELLATTNSIRSFAADEPPNSAPPMDKPKPQPHDRE